MSSFLLKRALLKASLSLKATVPISFHLTLENWQSVSKYCINKHGIAEHFPNCQMVTCFFVCLFLILNNAQHTCGLDGALCSHLRKSI